MILLNENLQKIEDAFGCPQNLISRIKYRATQVSGNDKLILDCLIVIGNNMIELKTPILPEILRYKDISCYVVERLRVMCDELKCLHLAFIADLIEYNYAYCGQLRRLA